MSIPSRVDAFEYAEGNTTSIVMARSATGAAESKTWSMGGNFKHENRETP
jgi:hypothetical protein